MPLTTAPDTRAVPLYLIAPEGLEAWRGEVESPLDALHGDLED